MKSINPQIANLEHAINTLEAQRAVLGDEVVEDSISALKKQLAELRAQAENLEQQRKQVTILFVDIVGHTAMIRDLDPEENMSIIDKALAQLAEPVQQHGGRIARYQGDGFKAVFGLPVAHENDPDNAVRAGLGILAESTRIARDLQETWGISKFQVRVGIDTGLVLSGGETEGEDTIKGTPVNLASRLESTADPGSVVISHNTYQHVRGAYHLERLEPLIVKGFPEPVLIYRVLGEKGRSFRGRRRGVEGVETRMIGRNRELSLLQEIYIDVLEEGEHQMATLVGEAGVGKSRLLYEFENWIELEPESVQLYQGRAHLESRRLPYGLLWSLFAFRFGIQEDDPLELVREKWLAGFQQDWGTDNESEPVKQVKMRAVILGHLLGVDFSDHLQVQPVLNDPQQLRDRSLIYLLDFFKQVSQQSIVVILLEDLHWADDSSLDMLSQFGVRLMQAPLMVVGTARFELYDRRPYWFEGRVFHRRVDLKPLSRRVCRGMVAEVLQKVPDIPESLEEMIVTQAEGNPFYVEELVKVLVEAAVIVKDVPHWWVDEQRLAEYDVPSTLTGVLQARLERLPRAERTLIQQASVVGRIFWDQAVTYLNRRNGSRLAESDIKEGLNRLRSRELIYRRELSTFMEAEEYIFKHAVLREVTYEGVLKSQRRTYHKLVAEWLIERSREQSGELLGLIADHLDLADEHTLAVEYLAAAGEQAAARYANEDAINYFSRALELAPRVSLPKPEYTALHYRRGCFSAIMGKFDQAQADLEFSLELARSEGLRKIEWQILLELGKLWASTDYNQTHHYFAQALDLARELNEPALLAGSLNQMGNWYANAEQSVEAIACHKEAMQILTAGGNQRDLAITLDLLGVSHLLAGDYFASKQYYDRAIGLLRELNDLTYLVSSLMGRGAINAFPTLLAMVPYLNPENARKDFAESIEYSHKVGAAHGEPGSLWALGLLEIALGEFDRANAAIQRGLHIAETVGHREFFVANLFSQSVYFITLLAPEQACQVLEQAQTITRELGSQYWIRHINTAHAAAHLLAGELAESQLALDEVLNADTPMDTKGKRYCWAIQVDLLLRRGQSEQALVILDRLIATAPGMQPGLVIPYLWKQRAEALASLGQSQPADDLLLEAIAHVETSGERFLQWQLYASLGRLHQHERRQPEADKAFTTAQREIKALAEKIPDETLKTNFFQQAEASCK